MLFLLFLIQISLSQQYPIKEGKVYTYNQDSYGNYTLGKCFTCYTSYYCKLQIELQNNIPELIAYHFQIINVNHQLKFKN